MAVAFAVSLVATAFGCGLLRSPSVPPTTFYILSATSERGQIPTGRPLTLGLGPVKLPPYLNRPEMVRRVAPNQLSFDEFNRWSEPLKDNVVRVLAADLDALLGLDRVIFYPWYSSTPMDYSVAVTVLRFEPQPDGNAVLDARWSIGNGRGEQLASRDVHFEHPAGAPAQTAAALSAMLGDLATEIGTALRTLDAAHRK
jgi:uncharacterized lipoprotein YmbA